MAPPGVQLYAVFYGFILTVLDIVGHYATKTIQAVIWVQLATEPMVHLLFLFIYFFLPSF